MALQSVNELRDDIVLKAPRTLRFIIIEFTLLNIFILESKKFFSLYFSKKKINDINLFITKSLSKTTHRCSS